MCNISLQIGAPSSEAAIHHDRKRMKSSPSAATELQAASNVLSNKSFEEFLARNPKPEEDPILFSQLVDTLPAKEQEFFMKNVQITNEEAMELCASTVQQNGPLWMRERKLRITGSVCYSIFTYVKNKSPDWGKKLDSLMNSTFRGNANTIRGQQSEPAARAAYHALTGNEVQAMGFVVNPNAAWLGFSPDGVTSANGSPVLVEIKTLKAGTMMNSEAVVRSCPFITDDRKLKKKHAYYGQVQLGMELLKIKKTDLIIYAPFDDSCTVINVDRDETFIRELIPSLASVYYNQFLPHHAK
jgi:YqaJ-like viral recombinase domain